MGEHERLTTGPIRDPHSGEPIPAAVQFETVTELAGTLDAISVFRAAWGESDAQDVDTYFAAAAHGSYLCVGRIEGQPVAAAFAFLSLDALTGGLGLHSHMAAVIPDVASQGIGRAIKFHQRDWATARGISAITWTFDPLQRRNAWFNLVSLGASVIGFRANYYGVLDDAINGVDETDRFEVRWPVADDRVDGAQRFLIEPLSSDRLVAVPADIGILRREDPSSAAAERMRLRAELVGVELGTHRVVGMSADHCYVVRECTEPPVSGVLGTEP